MPLNDDAMDEGGSGMKMGVEEYLRVLESKKRLNKMTEEEKRHPLLEAVRNTSHKYKERMKKESGGPRSCWDFLTVWN